MKNYNNYIKKHLEKDSSLKSEMEFESWLFQVSINIAKLRKAKGYSQEKFADMLNMTQSAVARIESGQNMKCSTLWKISDLLEERLELFGANKEVEKEKIALYCDFAKQKEQIGSTGNQKDVIYSTKNSPLIPNFISNGLFA